MPSSLYRCFVNLKYIIYKHSTQAWILLNQPVLHKVLHQINCIQSSPPWKKRIPHQILFLWVSVTIYVFLHHEPVAVTCYNADALPCTQLILLNNAIPCLQRYVPEYLHSMHTSMLAFHVYIKTAFHTTDFNMSQMRILLLNRAVSISWLPECLHSKHTQMST